MNIPSDLEFLSAIEMLRTGACQGFEGVEQLSLTKESIHAFILTVFATQDSANEKIRRSPAFIWYRNQLSIQRIEKKIRSKAKQLTDLSDDQIALEITEHYLAGKVTRDKSGKNGTSWIRHRLANFGRPGAFHVWRAEILEAYRSYFHTDRNIAIYDEFRTRDELLRKAEDAIQTLKRCANFQVYPLRRTSALASLESQIVSLREVPVDGLYPVRRKDESMKERLLASDLYFANIRYFGKPRASFVYDMLGIDGIERPLDMRTVERLISRIDAARIECREKLIL